MNSTDAPTTGTDDRSDEEVMTPSWLRQVLESIQNSTSIDRITPVLQQSARYVARGRAREILEGRPIGHALHPLLTDLPLGLWTSAAILDLIGGSRSRVAARRLIGGGLLAAPLTVASGLVDYSKITSDHSKRIAAVHALGNGAVAWLYLLSWTARRDGRHASGMLYGFTGAALAMGTGYLGGHLSYAHSVGTGERGWEPSHDGDRRAAVAPEPAL